MKPAVHHMMALTLCAMSAENVCLCKHGEGRQVSEYGLEGVCLTHNAEHCFKCYKGYECDSASTHACVRKPLDVPDESPSWRKPARKCGIIDIVPLNATHLDRNVSFEVFTRTLGAQDGFIRNFMQPNRELLVEGRRMGSGAPYTPPAGSSANGFSGGGLPPPLPPIKVPGMSEVYSATNPFADIGYESTFTDTVWLCNEPPHHTGCFNGKELC